MGSMLSGGIQNRELAIIVNLLPFLLVSALGFSYLLFDSNNLALILLYMLGGLVGFLKAFIIGAKHVSDTSDLSNQISNLKQHMDDRKRIVFNLFEGSVDNDPGFLRYESDYNAKRQERNDLETRDARKNARSEHIVWGMLVAHIAAFILYGTLRHY